MIEKPGGDAAEYLDAGADWISVHVEATHHLQRCLDTIRRGGAQGRRRDQSRALRPGRSRHAWADLDYAVVMSVNPGWGGQPFLAPSIDKVRRLQDEGSRPRAAASRSRWTGESTAAMPAMLCRGRRGDPRSGHGRFTGRRIPAGAIGKLREAARGTVGHDAAMLRTIRTER